MKKIWYRLPVKAAAVVLNILAAIILAAGLVGFLIMADIGLYQQNRPWNYYQTYLCSSQAYSDAAEAAMEYYYTARLDELNPQDWEIEQTLAAYQERFGSGQTNFRFTLWSGGEKQAISTYSGEDFGFRDMHLFWIYDPVLDEEIEVRVDCYVLQNLTVQDDYYHQQQLCGNLYAVRYTVFWMIGIAGLMVLLTMIYLICSAGRKGNDGHLAVGGLHRAPFDLLTAAVIGAAVLVICLLAACADIGNMFSAAIGMMVSIVMLYGLCLFYVMSFAVRCKSHTLWKKTLIYRMYAWIKKRWLSLYRSLPQIWKGLLVVTSAGLVTVVAGTFCIAVRSVPLFWLYMIVLLLVLGGLTAAYQLQNRKLQQSLEQMAKGSLDEQIDVSCLYGEMRRQGENLNHIHQAVQTAVEERIRSERMKTELITNVSHDIKTPLTSIVNYVDLLKKEEMQSPVCQEYIEVLDRQAVRLKKLIEDLIEASKASTGNLSMNLTQLDAAELLKQVAGEYTERMQQQHLELILRAPDTAVPVIADGQRLWRVFDNLLGNALKYSQPGTRVYLDLEEAGGTGGRPFAVATFRNISRCALSVSGEELAERFVRGDSSRHTEGSGLGLSIARSLMELMHGQLQIHVDGDLFKVQVSIPKTE